MENQQDDEFTFTWIIEDFSMCPVYASSYLNSPEFAIDFLPGIKFTIKLYSVFCPVFIQIIGLNQIPRNFKFRYRIEGLDCNAKRFFCLESEKHNHPNYFGYQLFRELINDILILKFTFKQVCEENQEESLPPLPYNNGLYADIVLCASGAEFKVHKAILWARWPKLVEKLDAESTSHLVLDIQPNVLDAILKYVYTGKMDFRGDDFSAEISDAAEKYELPHLICIPVILAQKCRTRPNVQNVSFEWPINNFSKLPVNTVLRSQVFTLGVAKSWRWNLILHIREDKQHDRIFDISVYGACDDKEKHIFVRSKIFYAVPEINSSKSIIRIRCSEHEHWSVPNESCMCAKFVRSISIDPEDILILKCELKFSDGSYDSQTLETSYAFSSAINCRYLSNDMENLFQLETLSDVDIVVGSDTLRAHKFILCARSSIFSRIFEETIQSEDSSIKIPNGDSSVINRMLRFLYSGNCDLFLGNLAKDTDVMKLYAAAEKYDIPALKKKCTSYLKSNLYVNNIQEVLQFAGEHSNDGLFDIVFEFISARAEEVFSTDKWKEIKKNNVWAKLLEKAIFLKNPKK